MDLGLACVPALSGVGPSSRAKKESYQKMFYPRGTEGARQVLPGIEPGLPEDTDMIRIRSDNRYTTKPLNWLFLM
jgi:hypothetical protein